MLTVLQLVHVVPGRVIKAVPCQNTVKKKAQLST